MGRVAASSRASMTGAGSASGIGAGIARLFASISYVCTSTMIGDLRAREGENYAAVSKPKTIVALKSMVVVWTEDLGG